MAPERRALALVLLCVACHGKRSTGTHKAGVTAAPSASVGADGSPVLAALDGRVLTLRDFDERLSRQPPALRAQYRSAGARRRLLDDMVRLELLADEARRRGLDRSPEVRDRISELLAEELMNDVFVVDAKTSDVSDAEVQAYYDAHAAEFRVPEEREAIALVLDTRARADEALRRAAAHPRDAAFFRGLAHSDRGNPASYDTGFIARTAEGRLPAAARDAVFDMRAVGEVRPVVAGDGAYYVLMLTGIRPGLVREPKDVATLVRQRLHAERRSRAVAEFVDGLRVRGHTQVHPERLGDAASSASPSASAPPTD